MQAAQFMTVSRVLAFADINADPHPFVDKGIMILTFEGCAVLVSLSVITPSVCGNLSQPNPKPKPCHPLQACIALLINFDINNVTWFLKAATG